MCSPTPLRTSRPRTSGGPSRAPRSSTSSWRTRARARAARAARGVRGRAAWTKCPPAATETGAYVKVATAVRTYDTVETLVMALVPETARLPDAQRAVRMALAEIVYQNGSQTKKDSKYDLLDQEVALLRAARGSAHARDPRAPSGEGGGAREDAGRVPIPVLANAAVRLYHYERGGSLASAELVKLQLRGDPKYVRGVCTRMAHALVTGDLDFVPALRRRPGRVLGAHAASRRCAARAHRSGGRRAGSDELARLAPRAPRQEQPQAQGHDARRARPLPDGRGGRERPRPASAGASSIRSTPTSRRRLTCRCSRR